MKKFLPLILLLVVVSGILVYAQTSQNKPVANTNQTVEQVITVVLDTADGQPKSYVVRDLANPTAFTALQYITTQQGIALDYDPPGEFGVFVKAIAGKVGSAEQFWIYQVNGVDGQVAADKQILTNGDILTWKYTTASSS